MHKKNWVSWWKWTVSDSKCHSYNAIFGKKNEQFRIEIGKFRIKTSQFKIKISEFRTKISEFWTYKSDKFLNQNDHICSKFSGFSHENVIFKIFDSGNKNLFRDFGISFEGTFGIYVNPLY